MLNWQDSTGNVTTRGWQLRKKTVVSEPLGIHLLSLFMHCIGGQSGRPCEACSLTAIVAGKNAIAVFRKPAARFGPDKQGNRIEFPGGGTHLTILCPCWFRGGLSLRIDGGICKTSRYLPIELLQISDPTLTHPVGSAISG